MKKFTLLTENKAKKSYKVDVNITLIIDSEDEGEAGYLADSIISVLDNLYDYSILDIEHTDLIIEEKNNKL